MDLNKIYEECSKMKVGEEKKFELDEVSDRTDLIRMVVKLCKPSAGKAVGLRCSDTTVYAFCFSTEDSFRALRG